MEPEIITEAQTWLVNNQGLLIEYAVNIAAALLTLLVGYIAANLLSGGVVKVMQARKLDTTVTHFVGSILKYAILVFVVIASAILNGTIVNYSRMDTRRVDMTFGIGYGSDLRKAKQILERLVNEEPRILKDPAATIAVAALADSSVNIVVRPWVKTGDYWGVWFDFHEKVKLTFDAEEIEIPFPQMVMHMQKTQA